MEVYIGELPPEVTPADLAEFLWGVHKKIRVEIVKRQFTDGTEARFAVVHYPTERAGRKAINRLNGKRLGGVPMEVREFQHRAYANERRTLGWRDQHRSEGEERRRRERRRVEVQTPDEDDLFAAPASGHQAAEAQVTVSFNAYHSMARKH